MKLGSLRITLPDGQSRDFVVEQASLGAGRAPDNDLIIDDQSLSRRHARLTFEAGRLMVEDLGSANGTFAGSQRLEANTPSLVAEDDVLRLGDVELRYTPPITERPAASSSAGQATMMMDGPVAATRFGALRIRMPDGAQRDFAMDVPSITVGRAPENQLVIDDTTVSRRHARLSVESSRLLIEDLGSANGTFIGTQRLGANKPSLVSEDQPVRVGDVELRYLPPTPLAAAKNFGEAASEGTMAPPSRVEPVGPPVNVSLVGPVQPVAPGSVTTATLTLQNRGTVVDEFVIQVAGVPADWVRLSKDRVPLLPNAQEQVTVSFQPPRRAEAVAADHRFTLTVASREHRTSVSVPGVVKVLPYQGFALTLQPVRSSRDFQLIALNQGNAPVSFNLTGSDDERSLLYQFAQPTITLAPGQTLNVALAVTPRVAPRIGTRETRAFSVLAQPATPASGPEARASGQLIIRPPIPIWLIPLAIILSLCLCITSAYAYVTFCPTYFPNAPFCPAGAVPLINVFTATPTEVDKGSVVVIAWDVSNAEKVEMVQPAPETLEASGLRTFTVDANTTFILRATNFAGSVEQPVFVTVRGAQPAIETFTANPGVITAGQTDRVVLSWTTIGATSVSIEGVPGQNFPATGSVEVPAPSANTTYTLVATNETGTVRQEVTVVISSAECTVTNVVAPDRLNMYEGPAGGYAIVVQLDNGTRVDPLGRNSTGDWLKVRAAGREGWVATNFITCTGVADLAVYPTVNPAQIPTLAPTATLTPVPPTATGTSVPSTATPTNTPSPTPTATPVFTSGGLITYRVQSGGRTTIYLQNTNGAPIALVFDKDDANMLDYTPNNGGRFAIWVVEGGQQKVFIINREGQLVGGPITGGWGDITDADWSYDGQRLVIEAVTAGATNYHYYDANGSALGQPALP
jgi:pSer/pThr/pTyr-binding forkhead associated (FHA) protein/uncharacterized protein YraI